MVDQGRKRYASARRPGPSERIIAKIEQYASDPSSLAAQVTALTGTSYLRLRVGSYRVIFGTDHDEGAHMVVLRVRHRREAYGS